MQEKRVRTGSKLRNVYVPNPREKAWLRTQLRALYNIARDVCDPEVVHGFAELRSAVTNAMCHIGYRWSVSFDLADCFDHVTQDRSFEIVKGRHWIVVRGSNTGYAFVNPSPTDIHRFFPKGAARAGPPTSPVIANLCLTGLDRKLKRLASVYTRYADDLTFSTNDVGVVRALVARVPEICESEGFPVNCSKSRVLCGDWGYRIITGIAVGYDGIYPTRRTKRKLRAALHNLETCRVTKWPRRAWAKYVKGQKHRGKEPLPRKVWLARYLRLRIKGIQEWMSLKQPTVGRRSHVAEPRDLET